MAVLALRSQTTHVACSCDCVCTAQNKLRLLYRGSEDGFTRTAFWQRCEGKANTLTVVKVSHLCSLGSACLIHVGAAHLPRCFCSVHAQVKENGNVFAVFTPLAWPTGASGYTADPSGRTFIVSLVNKSNRPFRLNLKKGSEQYAISRDESDGPCFGGGHDLALLVMASSYCNSRSFELDAEAESLAGLPPLPFAYDKTLLPGVDSGKGVTYNCFSLAELECYTLDA